MRRRFGIIFAIFLSPLVMAAAAPPVVAQPGDGSAAPSPSPSPAPPAAPPHPSPAADPPPPDAATALERARSSYEYGDMEMVVDAARLVAEGRLRPTPAQRAQALRFLGIGLFLTGRTEGAETAFFDLLRLKPGAKLDTTNTRPDVVAFFEGVRSRHSDEIRQAAKTPPGKRFIWCFLPPVGQFQNGHHARGWTIATLELVSLGTAIASYAQLKAWQNPTDDTFGPHTDAAHSLKTLNGVAVGVFAATVIIGIIDAVSNYGDDHEERSVVKLSPAGLTFRF
ncbi:MAG TPA: hypothetical protein VFH73_27275 [Polyangia bacterium]|jgi:hypothetical protein|nr:hypothetical protein [Polyangia bacterium]